MQKKRFKAFRVHEDESGNARHKVEEQQIDDLPKEGVLIRVHYSSLNYKDALSASVHKGITRSYPHTPGIDAAGSVEEPGQSDFEKGAPVIVTSYDLGMNTPGGFGEFIRVPADWIVPLPGGLTLRESMILGTAGFTAGLSLWRLFKSGARPTSHPRLIVTGATGGVGSLAIAMASSLGYEVTAVTGKQEHHHYLRQLGAEKILTRTEAADHPDKPLLKRRWDAGIDTVGGTLLPGLLKSVRIDGIVTCCGNVGGDQLSVSLYPFILRGISLLGIDSGNCPMQRRQKVWQRLADDWKPASSKLERLTEEQTLDTLSRAIQVMLDGKSTGRKLVVLKE